MQTKLPAIEKLIGNFQRRPIPTMATLMVVVVIVCYYVIKGTYWDRIEEITTEKKTVLTRINISSTVSEKEQYH